MREFKLLLGWEGEEDEFVEGNLTLRTEVRAALNDLYSGQCGLEIEKKGHLDTNHSRMRKTLIFVNSEIYFKISFRRTNSFPTCLVRPFISDY